MFHKRKNNQTVFHDNHKITKDQKDYPNDKEAGSQNIPEYKFRTPLPKYP